MNRREFLLLAAGCAGGCAAFNSTAHAAGGAGRVVDAGPVSQYQRDGVYTSFMRSGFFVIRSEGRLFALSSYCTHRRCKLESEADHTFYCPCHGSEFDAKGKVKEGPAVRDLPVLSTATNSAGHLLVTVG